MSRPSAERLLRHCAPHLLEHLEPASARTRLSIITLTSRGIRLATVAL